jgi:hypothetical protein
LRFVLTLCTAFPATGIVIPLHGYSCPIHCVHLTAGRALSIRLTSLFSSHLIENQAVERGWNPIALAIEASSHQFFNLSMLSSSSKFQPPIISVQFGQTNLLLTIQV